jgi:hypothetical protein
VGTSFGGGIDQTFAGHGEALKPYSPVHLAVEADDSGALTFTWIRRNRLGAELPSGTDIAMSEATESYQVQVYGADGTTLVRTYTPITPSQVYSTADQVADRGTILAAGATIAFQVSQLSAIVGAGYPTKLVTTVGGVPPPPPVLRTLQIIFGGSFNSADNCAVSITYTPDSGAAPIVLSFTLLGSGKGSTSDYATDLAAQVAASAIGAHATAVSAAGLFTLTSNTGGLLATVDDHWPFATTTALQAPGPAGPSADGLGSVYFVDFYASSGGVSPATSPDYQHLVNLSESLYAFSEDIVANRALRLNQSVPVPAGLEEGDPTAGSLPGQYSYVVAVSYASPNVSGYLAKLAPLVDALNADNGFHNILHANAYLGSTTGPDGGMTRSAVVIQLPPGYHLIAGSGLSDNPGPGSYTARVERLTQGYAAYASGRSQVASVSYADRRDNTFVYVSDLELGQDYTVTLDGTTYTHTVDSGDMADVRTDIPGATAHYRDGIYEDLKTQIEAGGNFTVQLSKLYRVPGGPDTFIYMMVITRTAGDTAFTLAADVPFGLTHTVSTF